MVILPRPLTLGKRINRWSSCFMRLSSKRSLGKNGVMDGILFKRVNVCHLTSRHCVQGLNGFRGCSRCRKHPDFYSAFLRGAHCAFAYGRKTVASSPALRLLAIFVPCTRLKPRPTWRPRRGAYCSLDARALRERRTRARALARGTVQCVLFGIYGNRVLLGVAM